MRMRGSAASPCSASLTLAKLYRRSTKDVAFILKLLSRHRPMSQLIRWSAVQTHKTSILE